MLRSVRLGFAEIRFSRFALEARSLQRLAAYIIHQLVEGAMRPYTPRDSPLWFALASFALFLGICYVFVRHLEKNNLFLRM